MDQREKDGIISSLNEITNGKIYLYKETKMCQKEKELGNEIL